jgi:hypothetical protein
MVIAAGRPRPPRLARPAITPPAALIDKAASAVFTRTNLENFAAQADEMGLSITGS